VDNPYPDASPIPFPNTVSIDADELLTPQTSTTYTFIDAPRPAFNLQKSASEPFVAPNSNVIFTISYLNEGNASATNVVLTDDIPDGCTFVSATPAATSAPPVGGTGTVSWSLGTIASGGSGSVTLVVNVPDPFNGSANPLINTAEIDSDQTNPVHATASVGVTQVDDICYDFYFKDASTNVGVEDPGTLYGGIENIATTDVPVGAGNSITVTTLGGANNYIDVFEFYQDPPITTATDFAGNITTNVYIDRVNGAGITLRGTVYTYDPSDGSTASLGSGTQSFNGSAKGLFSFTVPLSGTIPKGHRLLWDFDVTANNSQTPQLQFQFDGTVTNALTGDGSSTEANSGATFCVTPPANLVMGKTVDQLTASPGDTLVYTISFANIGQSNATNSQVTDTLPLGLSFVSATLNGLAATPASVFGQAYTFNVNSDDTAVVGQVTGGEQGALTITAIVDQPLNPAINTALNSATILSDQTSPVVDTATTEILIPALTLTKSVDDSLLVIGETVTYSLTVLNSGEADATNVTFSDLLPETGYFVYVADSTELDGVPIAPDPYSGGTITYNMGTLASGASATLTYQMEVINNSVPDGITRIANTASVLDDDTGTTTSNTVEISISTNPNLQITKAVTPAGAASAGDTLTYTLTVNNFGSSAAEDVLVSDAIPSFAHFVSGSMVYETVSQTDVDDVDQGRYEAVPNRVVFDLGTVAAGASLTMSFAVTLDVPMPNGTTTVTNTATISASNDSSKSSSVSNDVSAAPVLFVTKGGPTEAPLPYSALSSNVTADVFVDMVSVSGLVVGQYVQISGSVRQIVAINGNQLELDAAITASSGDFVYGSVTYSIFYQNTGNAVASNAVLTDTLPGGTVFVDATSGGVHAAGVVTWILGDLAPGESGTVQVRIISTSTGVLTDVAELICDETGPISDNAITSFGGLIVTKTTSTPTVNQTPTGTSADYEITVENTLATDATGVVVSDALSAGFTFASTGTITGHSANTAPITPTIGTDAPQWGTFTIPAGATLSIPFTVDIDASVGEATYQNAVGVTSTNTAVIQYDELDSAGEDVTVLGVVTADVAVTKNLDTTGPFVPGQSISYTITVTNNGPDTATNIQVTDTPTNLSITNVSSTNCSGFPCTIPSLASVASEVITVTATINAAGAFDNSVSVTATEFDPDTTNNTDNTGNGGTASGSPVLSATKVDALNVDFGSDGQVNPGDVVRYTVVITNSGDVQSTNVVFSDTPSANSTLIVGSVATSQGAIAVGNTAGDSSVSVNVGTIAALGSVTISFDVVIDNPFPNGANQISNQGNVASGELPDVPTDDPDSPTSDDPTVTPVVASPVLAVTKVDALLVDQGAVGQVNPGDTIRYTISISNSGDTGATAVVFTDTPDANTQLVVGSVATSQGTVTSGNAAGNSSVAVDIGTIAASATVTITFDALVDNPISVGVTSIANQGLVQSTELPDVPTDDPDTPTSDDPTGTPIVANPVLAVTKADALLVDQGAIGQVNPGDTIRYTISISNSGDTGATAVVFTDTPDANTQLVVGSVTTSQGTVTLGNAAGNLSVAVDVGTIAASASVTITFDVLVDDPISAGVTSIANQGLVQSTELPDLPTDDPDTPTSDDPTGTPIGAEPELSVSKVDSLSLDADGDGVLSPGDTLEYTITIVNAGDTAATAVTFSDTPDSNTTLVNGSVTTSQGSVTSGNGGEGIVGVDVGTVLVGTDVTITFQVLIDQPFPSGVSQVSNQGSVASAELPDVPTDDPDTGTPDDPTVSPVQAAPILDVEKFDTLSGDNDLDGVPSPGDALTYTVTVTNSGNGGATNLQLTDSIPAYTSLVIGSVTTTQGTINTEDPVDVSLGDLDAGNSATVTFVVTIDNPLPAGVNSLANQAWISSTELPITPSDDPDTGPADDPTETPVTSAPDVDLTKQAILSDDADGNGFASPGDTLTYTLNLLNNGNANAPNVLLDDMPDPNTALVVGSVTTSQGTVLVGNTAGDISVSVDVGTLNGSGGTVTVSYEVTIDNPLPAGTTMVSNQAIASGDTIPDTPSDDPDTPEEDDETDVPVVANPILDAFKSDSVFNDADGSGTASPGDTLLYQVRIVNSGNSAATGLVFSDLISDPNLSLVVGSVQTSPVGLVVDSGNTAGDSAVQVTIGNLAGGGAEVIITFQVLIANPVGSGVTQVSNQGLVTGTDVPDVPTDDPDTPEDDDDTDVPIDATPIIDAFKDSILFQDLDNDGVISPGDILSYTVTISNSGNTTATGLFFNDTPDPNTTLLAGTIISSQGSVVSGQDGTPPIEVDLGDLAAGQSATLSFRVQIDNPVPAGTTVVVNQGVVTFNEGPPVPTDDPDTPVDDDETEDVVVAEPNLQAFKQDTLLVDADGNGFASPGDTLSYQITIHNSGNTSSTGVIFSDTPDANTTLVTGSVMTSRGTVTGGNAGTPPVTVDLGEIPGGESAVISFQVTINNPLPAGVEIISNQGLVSSNEEPDLPTDDPDVPGDDDPTDTPVTADPVLSVIKTDSLFDDADGDGFVSPGDTLLYIITVANSGNTAATGLTFEDTPDVNTTIVPGTVQTSRGSVISGNAGTPPIEVDLGNLPANEQAVISFQVTINDPFPVGVTQVSNQGLVTDGEVILVPTDDPDTTDSDDPTDTPVQVLPILSAEKTDVLSNDADGNGLVSPGDTLTYTITILSSGSSGATNVLFNDTPDPNTTLVVGSVTASQGTVVTGNTAGDSSVSVDLGSITGGGSTAVVSFQVLINDPLPSNVTSVSNQGVISSTELPDLPTDDPDDPNPDDPTDTDIPLADLSVQKTDQADPVTVGDTITYDLLVQNLGPSDASGVVVVDSLPAEVDFVSATSSQGTFNYDNVAHTVTFTLGTIANLGNANLSVTVLTQADGVVTNDVTVTADQFDPDVTNNDDSEETTVDPLIDLWLTKTADPMNPDYLGTVTFTIRITNDGPSPATGIVVQETWPGDLALLSSSTTTGTYDPGTGLWTIGDLANGAFAELTLVGQVQTTGPITNTAEVAQANEMDIDSTPGNGNTAEDDWAQVVLTVNASLDLILTKTVEAETPYPGTQMVYRIEVQNLGPGTSTGTMVTDVLPAEVIFVSATATQGQYDPLTSEWDIGLMASGDIHECTILVEIQEDVPPGTIILNQAVVTSDVPDIDITNNDDQAPIGVLADIPTLGEWMLGLLILLMGLAAIKISRQ